MHRRYVLAVGVLCGAATLGAAPMAGASPANAPTAIHGTFDCGGGVTGTFVLNSGRAKAPTTWASAHGTFADGSTAVFVPSFMDVTISFPGQPPVHQVVQKGNAPVEQTCSISAPLAGGGSLSGTVGGKFVPGA